MRAPLKCVKTEGPLYEMQQFEFTVSNPFATGAAVKSSVRCFSFLSHTQRLCCVMHRSPFNTHTRKQDTLELIMSLHSDRNYAIQLTHKPFKLIPTCVCLSCLRSDCDFTIQLLHEPAEPKPKTVEGKKGKGAAKKATGKKEEAGEKKGMCA